MHNPLPAAVDEEGRGGDRDHDGDEILHGGGDRGRDTGDRGQGKPKQLVPRRKTSRAAPDR